MGEHEHHHHRHHGECWEGMQGGPGEHRHPNREERCCHGHGGRGWRHHGGGEGCGGAGEGPRFRRRFLTREEKIARLEEYLRALQAEAKAVEERLAELRG